MLYLFIKYYLFKYLETRFSDDNSTNGADVAVDVPLPERHVVPSLELEDLRVLLELALRPVLLERQFLQSRRRNEKLLLRLFRLQLVLSNRQQRLGVGRVVRASALELEMILARSESEKIRRS